MASSNPSPFMQYDHDSGITARWHGGAYIELGYSDAGEFEAHDVINVWDYAKGEARIPQTLAAFQETVDERIADDIAEGEER